jgi:hypothetical protein
MIELSFTIDEEDIAETEQYLRKVPFDRYLCYEYDAPKGFIRFFINGGENMSFCGEWDKDELIPFALGLNTILHTIQEGKEEVHPHLSEAGDLYYNLVDAQTISVTLSLGSLTTVQCDFAELKSKAESFCQDLYNEIMRLFPNYFETMDQYSQESKDERGETQVERVIKMLLRKE